MALVHGYLLMSYVDGMSKLGCLPSHWAVTHTHGCMCLVLETIGPEDALGRIVFFIPPFSNTNHPVHLLHFYSASLCSRLQLAVRGALGLPEGRDAQGLC